MGSSDRGDQGAAYHGSSGHASSGHLGYGTDAGAGAFSMPSNDPPNRANATTWPLNDKAKDDATTGKDEAVGHRMRLNNVQQAHIVGLLASNGERYVNDSIPESVFFEEIAKKAAAELRLPQLTGKHVRERIHQRVCSPRRASAIKHDATTPLDHAIDKWNGFFLKRKREDAGAEPQAMERLPAETGQLLLQSAVQTLAESYETFCDEDATREEWKKAETALAILSMLQDPSFLGFKQRDQLHSWTRNQKSGYQPGLLQDSDLLPPRQLSNRLCKCIRRVKHKRNRKRGTTVNQEEAPKKPRKKNNTKKWRAFPMTRSQHAAAAAAAAAEAAAPTQRGKRLAEDDGESTGERPLKKLKKESENNERTAEGNGKVSEWVSPARSSPAQQSGPVDPGGHGPADEESVFVEPFPLLAATDAAQVGGSSKGKHGVHRSSEHAREHQRDFDESLEMEALTALKKAGKRRKKGKRVKEEPME